VRVPVAIQSPESIEAEIESEIEVEIEVVSESVTAFGGGARVEVGAVVKAAVRVAIEAG
jgi:hypothetical protein